MSEIVDTLDCGRFRRVTDGKMKWWLWECQTCKEWWQLSEEQLNGDAAVLCHGEWISKQFGRALVASLLAARLMEMPPTHEELEPWAGEGKL